MEGGQQKKTNPPQIQSHLQSTDGIQHDTTLSDPQAQPQVKPVRNNKGQNANFNNTRRYNNNQGQNQGQGQGQYHNDGQRKGNPPKRGKKFNPNQSGRPKPNENVPKEAVKPVEENKAVQPAENVPSSNQSWSSVVSSHSKGSVVPPQIQPSQPQPQQHQQPSSIVQHPPKNRNRVHMNGQKKEYQQKVPRGDPAVDHAAPPPPHPKEDYNADAKIEAIQNAVVQQLTEMQTKADRLKSLQEEIRKIKEEKDVEIEQLMNRKASLSAKHKQLLDDLKSTENEIGQIDTNIEHLKKEKIQKIHVLDEQSRALLSN